VEKADLGLGGQQSFDGKSIPENMPMTPLWRPIRLKMFLRVKSCQGSTETVDCAVGFDIAVIRILSSIRSEAHCNSNDWIARVPKNEKERAHSPPGQTGTG
jgi:hypothetical protein